MKKINIHGRVQGVGFRYFTFQKAQKYSINGYVKNLYNGDVEVVVINEENPNYKEFLKEIKAGPISARVDQVEIEDYFGREYKSFVVER